MKDSGYNSQQGPWKFYSDLFLLFAFSSPEVYSAYQKWIPKNILRGEVGQCFCHPSCAECQSKDVSSTFHPPSEFLRPVRGQLILYFLHSQTPRNVFCFETVLMLHIPLLEVPFIKEMNMESLRITSHLRSAGKEWKSITKVHRTHILIPKIWYGKFLETKLANEFVSWLLRTSQHDT